MAEKLTLKLGIKIPAADGGVKVEVIKKRRVPGAGAAEIPPEPAALSPADARAEARAEARADKLKSILENAKKAEEQKKRESETQATAPESRTEQKKPEKKRERPDFDQEADSRRTKKPAGRKLDFSNVRVSEDDLDDFSEADTQISDSTKAAMDFISSHTHRRSYASIKRQREKNYRKFAEKSERKETARQPKEVVIPETISVKELSNRMAEKSSDVIKAMMKMGIMATINQIIDADTAELVVMEFGNTAKRVSESDVETMLSDNHEERLEPRAPVVTVMGHVDHGKTSLLDAMRQTDVASGEAGGITQHIGAYQITTKSGRKITFIDTPGHEAFSAMRARGASITDIVILVVAANDSIMPQTVEAINHAKAAEVPIIVAINKMDLPDANAQKVRQDLLQHSIVAEEMGGQTIAVEISAKQKLNLDKLEELLLLQADMLDLKGDTAGAAHGTVIEAKKEQGRGSTATILVKSGILKKGDIFVSGSAPGRVRELLDEHGRPVDEAKPSQPAVVVGFEGTPVAGDDFAVVETEAKAREIAQYRAKKETERKMARTKSSWQELFTSIKEGKAETLPVIIKADTQGSVEAISESLIKIPSEKVRTKIMHAGVGAINESDVQLAKTTGSAILAFNVRANAFARDMARGLDIDIRYYSVIYNMIDDVKTLMAGLLAPVVKEVFVGYADVIATFNAGKTKVAGCKVTEGVIKKGLGARMLRDDVVIFEGKLAQLKRQKEDIKEARQGVECGVSFDNFNDIQAGDKLECFDTEEVKATL
ncbi:MAG: translation initiation factor IF-2 [Rickettsiales bacterium]|jgi:translation initiation factor IF-2|nr:translation initiation factor IF-2 [Rickettsiales bacterium]